MTNMAKAMKHLESFVDIGTAFSNSDMNAGNIPCINEIEVKR